jgi:hypothetical protein
MAAALLSQLKWHWLRWGSFTRLGTASYAEQLQRRHRYCQPQTLGLIGGN